MNIEEIITELERILKIADDTDYMWYYDVDGVHEALLFLIQDLKENDQ